MNYIILVDEKGQPYIAHGIFSRARTAISNTTSKAKTAANNAVSSAKTTANNAASKAHKYLMKVGEGAKARYFYTKAEIDAFYGRGKTAASNVVNKAKGAASKAVTSAKKKAADTLGITAKNSRDKAYNDAMNASRRAGSMQLTAAMATADYKNAKANAKRVADQYNITNDEFNAAYAAMDAAGKVITDAQHNKTEADNKRNRAKADYDLYYADPSLATNLALAFSSNERDKKAKAYQAFIDAGMNAADATVAVNAAERAFNNAMKNYDSAKDKKIAAETDMSKAYLEEERANRKAKDTNTDAQYASYKATGAMAIYENLADEYAKTPLGKIESFFSKATDTVDQITDRASDAVDKAKNTASNAIDYVKQNAKDVGKYIKSHASDTLSDITDFFNTAEKSMKNVSDKARDKMNEAIKKGSQILDEVTDKLSKYTSGTNGIPSIKTYLNGSSTYRALVNKAVLTGVLPKAVKKHDTPLSDDDIISRISGGDKTKGSCSSLALTYIANKAGFDVLDFRGGSSCDLFSNVNTVEQITKLAGRDGHIAIASSAHDSAKQNLQYVEEGKEYYFAAGAHAAMVKKEGDNLYYLELQSPTSEDNGWQVLDDVVLTWRFACYYSSSRGMPSYLIDADALAHNKEFISLLGYINTDEKKEQKGRSGHVK